MIEVLITIVIVAFGLLGLAAFQLRAQTVELESFQRAQAIVLLSDMAARIQANRNNAASYVSTSLGTGAADCSTSGGTAAGDQCEWSNLLKGLAEQGSNGGIGAMIGARGCITQIQAPNPAAGVCAPGIYQISVAWQGMSPTVVPENSCGAGSYGSNDALRRVIATQVVIGLFGCS